MATMSFMLQRHGVLHTDSKEAIVERVTHYLCPHRMHLHNGTRLSSRFSVLHFKELAIIELCYGAHVEIAPEATPNVYLFRINLEGQGEIFYKDRQVRMVQGSATITSPCQTSLIHTSPNCHNIIVRVPRQLLEQRLSQHLAQPLRGPLLFDHYAPAHSPGSAFLLSTIHYLCHFPLNRLQPANDEAQIKRVEDYFCDSVLGLFNHTYSQHMSDTASPLPHYVKNAKAYIEQHITKPITLEALSHQAGVSIRTLQYGFRQFLGLSPGAYITRQRIKQIHQALLEAPKGQRVTDIVLQHGISSPGRFANQYKVIYGVTPVQTLNGNRHHTGIDL
ncbi:AraC family transcriptional regulator [Kushneria aurantia]|uniref:Helix-turn-helix domain-containing protein n=1 Tax=Kushneria aurantia TaxID=504092 RepID=A0ABV6G1E7_9GAMM|nr:AraC family transcriptional regulator [Kushneria aurantia]